MPKAALEKEGSASFAADPGSAGRRHRHVFTLVLLAGLAAAAALRFADLGRSAMRSDEINFYFGAARNASLVELWKNPPWLEQIPLGDSVPILWTRLTGMAVTERSVRLPFAMMGLATVLLCSLWLWRRQRWAAAALCAIWLGLSPFHVYHSREAYYYALTLFFVTGMFLKTLDLLEGLQEGRSAPAWHSYVRWVLWTSLACLGHPTAWPCAGGAWLLLAGSGWKRSKAEDRRRHRIALSFSTLFLAIWMSRWVFRSLLKVVRDFSGDQPLIGGSLAWIGPRVLPFFAGGANLVGWGLVLAVAVAVVWPVLRSRNRTDRDVLFAIVSRLLGVVALSVAIYVVGIGKGTAKLVYFGAPLPLLLVWVALAVDRFWRSFGQKARLWGMLGTLVLVAAALGYPAWQVAQLDGKPTAYRLIQAGLDAHLAPGDVAIVDRWYEPWNEMALYAPSNALVSFTVPDEPYESYVENRWRQTTQALFERNDAQAFVRLSRNHEERMGLWTWPETHFRRRAVVTNAAGVWLRDTGFAPMEEFYSEPNRVETEIFYDTHEDAADRAKAAGKDAAWFFGEGWRLFKPWQQGDFTDYRVLDGEATMTVHNLRSEPLNVKGEVVAAAMGGDQKIRIGNLAPMAFPAGQFASHSFEVEIQPGIQPLRWKNVGSGGALLVREFRLERAE